MVRRDKRVRISSMNQQPTNVEKLRGLPWSIGGNTSNTVFVQFTFFGSVFILFLSELGLNKSEMGFLLSLMPFFGLVALFIAPTVARYGYKRTFVTFFSLRKFVAALLLFTPWVLDSLGLTVTLIYISIIVGLFALCRAIAETAHYPWIQEYVPNNVRGKYSAANNAFTTVTGFIAVLTAGFVIGQTTGLNGFMILIGAGVLFGLIAAWSFAHIPGGAPLADAGQDAGYDLKTAAADPNFRRFLGGAGLIALAAPMISFLPLFMQEQVGLSRDNIIWLQAGTLAGALLSGYLWGWAADRYGSKPVMIWGLFIRLLLPIGWMLMPRHSEWSLLVALLIAISQGIADMGWGIGSARLLYVNVVPPERKADYMAIYYAWIGLLGGISQIGGGATVDLFQSLLGQTTLPYLDPYTPLFLAGLAMAATSILILRRVRADSVVGVGEFAGLFLRGNPFLAMESLLRYHMAKGERAAIRVTERLGQTKSPLTVDELLEALTDPRFNVRFEAIISVGRMRPDPRLARALEEILNGSEVALSVVAAWALGRMGDPQSQAALRAGLDAPYRSIQAHSARALGALGAQEAASLLLRRLRREEDKGMQMAYASALGQLQAAEAIGRLLELLAEMENEGARLELALSLARIVSSEDYFVQLARQTRHDPGTALAQAATAIKRKHERSADPLCLERLDKSAAALARNDLPAGVKALTEAIACLLEQEQIVETERQTILRQCAAILRADGASRLECVLLLFHLLSDAKLRAPRTP